MKVSRNKKIPRPTEPEPYDWNDWARDIVELLKARTSDVEFLKEENKNLRTQLDALDKTLKEVEINNAILKEYNIGKLRDDFIVLKVKTETRSTMLAFGISLLVSLIIGILQLYISLKDK